MTQADLGGARYTLDVDQEPLNRGMAQAQARTEQSAKAISQRLMAEMEAAARGTKKSTDGIVGDIEKVGKSGGSFNALAGRVAVWVTALASAKEALTGVQQATQDSIQAQTALNLQYKAGADGLKDYARQNALALGVTTTDAEKAFVAMATLNKEYGISREQIQQLVRVAADLSQVNGKTLVENAEKLTDALTGNTKAAESLGLSLSKDVLKNSALLTAEQKRNYDSLSDFTKARVTLNEIMRQAADLDGAAAASAGGSAAGFAVLRKESDDLAVAMGKGLLPTVNAMAGGLGTVIGVVNTAIRAFSDLKNVAGGFSDPFAFGVTTGDVTGIPGGDGRPEYGPTAEEVRNIQAAAQEHERIAAAQARGRSAEEERQRAESVKRVTQAVEERAEAEIRAAQEEADAGKQALDREKIRLEVEREQKLRAVEAKRDAALDGIRAEQDAFERAHQQRVALTQVARDAETKAAEETRGAALRSLDDEERAAIDSLERQVVATQKARDAEKQAAEDLRDATLRAIDDERDAAEEASRLEIALAQRAKQQALRDADETRDAALESIESQQRARERAHQRRIRQAEDARDRELRGTEETHERAMRALDAERQGIEDRRDAAVRALEDEQQAARDASQARMRAIDAEIDAERRRHREAIEGLEAEERARLGPLNDALKRLEEAGRAAQDADRDLQLTRALDKAKRDLSEAEATGSVRDIIEAREQVADAERAIEDERRERERDALRDSLESQVDTIRDEIAAKKDAARRELDLRLDVLGQQKDAERDALDRTLRNLADRVQAVRDAADQELRAISARQVSERDAHQESVRLTRERHDDQIRKIKDREQREKDSHVERKKDIQEAYESEREQVESTYDDPVDGLFAKLREQARVAREEYSNRSDAVRQAYEDEQRQIALTYDDPETGILAKLRQQKEDTVREYARRSDAVNAAYDTERERIEDVYDHPIDGLFAKLKQQASDAEREYARRTVAVQAAYRAERDEITSTYANTEKTGLLDRLEQARAETETKLADQVRYWRDWKRDVTKEIKDATTDLDAFYEKIRELDRELGITVQGSRVEQPRGRASGGGGGSAFPVVTSAKAHSYVTDQGTHSGGPAADIFANRGTPIYAPSGGRLEAFDAGRGGNAAILRGDDGRSYYFAHGNVPFRSGSVERGERIGQVGNTGAEGTDPHLHFAISDDPRDGFTRGRNGGSGNVWFGPELWRTDGRAPDPLDGAAGDSDLLIELLGRQIRISSRDLRPQGAQLIAAIERLGTSIGGRSFGRAAAAIAASETGGGHQLSEIGGTGAKGPFQFDPGGQLVNYARHLGLSRSEAGDYAIRNPMHAARWALDGYLGGALRSGLRGGLDGSSLAVYASREGQRPKAGNEEKAGEWHRRLYGYRDGGLISEPTLLVGKYRGPYGVMAEAGAERILSSDDTRAYDGSATQTAVVPVNVGGMTLAEIYVRGRRLAISTGRDTFR